MSKKNILISLIFVIISIAIGIYIYIPKGTYYEKAQIYESRGNHEKAQKYYLIAKEIDNKMLESINDGNFKRFQNLIKDGANPNTKNNNDQTALILASKNGYLEIVKELIKAGVREE